MDEIKFKIARARELIQELRDAVAEYHKSNPYDVRTRIDLQTRRLIYYVAAVKEIPPRIKLITGDVIQNLRSALDHLTYKLFITAGGSSASSRHIHFPIAQDETTFNSADTQRKMKGIAQPAIDAISALKPYRCGNEILWQIQELNNRDKHRLLITAGASFGSMDITAHMREGFGEILKSAGAILPSIFIEPAEKKFPLEVGDELFIDAPDAEPNPSINFNFQLLINEPGIIEGARLLPTVRAMADEVERIIDGFTGLV